MRKLSAYKQVVERESSSGIKVSSVYFNVSLMARYSWHCMHCCTYGNVRLSGMVLVVVVKGEVKVEAEAALLRNQESGLKFKSL